MAALRDGDPELAALGPLAVRERLETQLRRAASHGLTDFAGLDLEDIELSFPPGGAAKFEMLATHAGTTALRLLQRAVIEEYLTSTLVTNPPACAGLRK